MNQYFNEVKKKFCFNYFDTAHGYVGGKSENALRVGNDKLFLIKIISHCLPFIGYPRSLNALACVNKAAQNNEK